MSIQQRSCARTRGFAWIVALASVACGDDTSAADESDSTGEEMTGGPGASSDSMEPPETGTTVGTTDGDGFGAPSPTLPVPSGFCLFFNVAPGPHTVTLPGCDEGSGFWGPSSDGDIDVALVPGGTSLLTNLDCM